MILLAHIKPELFTKTELAKFVGFMGFDRFYFVFVNNMGLVVQIVTTAIKNSLRKLLHKKQQ